MLILESPFTLSPNGFLYNFGAVQGTRLDITGTSHIVQGCDATLALQNLQVNATCGICEICGYSTIFTDTFASGGGFNPLICAADTITGICINVGQDVTVNSTLGDTSTVYFCLADSSLFQSIDTIYYGGAIPGVCQCDAIFWHTPALYLEVHPVYDRPTLSVYPELRWELSPAIPVIQYCLYRRPYPSGSWTLLTCVDGYQSRYTDVSIRLFLPGTEWMYRVEGLLENGIWVHSPEVPFAWNSSMVIFTPVPVDGTVLEVLCMGAPGCDLGVYSLEGRCLREVRLQPGIHLIPFRRWMNVVLPAGGYVILLKGQGVLRLGKLK